MRDLHERSGDVDDFTGAVLLAAGIPIRRGNRWVGSEHSIDASPTRPGVWDRRVMLQSEWWADQFGQRHLLDDMPPTYRHEVLAFLREAESAMRFAAADLVEAEWRTGRINVLERERQLRLVELLVDGWTLRTQLGSRLARLEGPD